MFFKTIFYLLLCHQSICYIPPSLCSNLSFGKCSNGDFCGITNNGDYACLPCPANSLCPGDGYIYFASQLNKNMISLPKSNGSYIVNGRSLKRFRKIGKIIRVGLKVAAIAKTGGVVGLKSAAAAKAKQLAIRKGIQCLKNGLSNFCNGKKKTGSKIKPKASSGIRTKIGSINKKQVALVKLKPKPQIKPAVLSVKTKPTVTRKGGKPKVSIAKTKPKTAVTRKGGKPKVSMAKTKPKPAISSVKSKPKPSASLGQPCSNIFDTIANKVNNVTRHVAVKVVNKGRDWIKQRINGNSGNCVRPTSGAKRPTNLRGRTKSKPSVAKRPTVSNTSAKRRPKPSINRQPSGSTDDNSNNSGSTDDNSVIKSAPESSPRKVGPVIKPIGRPIQPRAKPVPTIQQSDDNVVPTRGPVRIPKIVRSPPPTNQQSDDNVVPTRRPAKKPKSVRSSAPMTQQSDNNVVPTRRPAKKPKSVRSSAPTNQQSDDNGVPTRRPIRRRGSPSPTVQQSDDNIVVPTRRPIRTRNQSRRRPSVVITVSPTANINTKLPRSNPTRRPTVSKTVITTIIPTRLQTRQPTRIPTISPTRIPTRVPSRSPTRIPTPVPTRSPTRIPTPLPTRRPTSVPTLTPISSPSMIPISWAMFSSAPVAPSNIPPTPFPTLSMFRLITFFPTTRPTPRASQPPSLLRTSVISNPTSRPVTTRSPTIGPTASSTLSPTALPTMTPTLSPITITNSPTTTGIGASALSSGSSSSSKSAVSSSTIGAAVGCVIIFIMLIAVCAFVINKKSKDKTPFQKWTDHYSVKRPTQVIDEDIHHFYNKGPRPSTPRLSINANTPFTPHLSGKSAFRNSQMGGQLGSQRNSLSPNKRMHPHNQL
jgi:hypothetical protein